MLSVCFIASTFSYGLVLFKCAASNCGKLEKYPCEVRCGEFRLLHETTKRPWFVFTLHLLV